MTYVACNGRRLLSLGMLSVVAGIAFSVFTTGVL
jgi:hypothetical protein